MQPIGSYFNSKVAHETEHCYLYTINDFQKKSAQEFKTIINPQEKSGAGVPKAVCG